jgi:hypothetical protein
MLVILSPSLLATSLEQLLLIELLALQEMTSFVVDRAMT